MSRFIHLTNIRVSRPRDRTLWALLDSLHMHDKCNFRDILFHFRNAAVSCDGLLNARYHHRIRCSRIVRNAAETYYSFYYTVIRVIIHIIVSVWNYICQYRDHLLSLIEKKMVYFTKLIY